MTMNQATDYYSENSFKQLCETEARNYVETRYVTPTWAKNIRGEYASLIYGTCKRNLNDKEGIFNPDGVDMDLAGNIGEFFKKHPHIDYVCPIEWRDRILTMLKENFMNVSGEYRKGLVTASSEDEIVAPADGAEQVPAQPEKPATADDMLAQKTIDPSMPAVQTMKDISNRLWSAWKVMSELVSSQLISRFNSGNLDEKDFTNAMKLRDSMKKIAADTDDLTLAFQIVKPKEDNSESNSKKK